MIALWDTTGNEVVKALSAERRNAGGVASGLALTLVAVVDEKRVREAEAAATIAAAAHPCRLLIVVRADSSRRPHSPARRRDRGRWPARAVRGGRHADVRPARPARRVGGDPAAGPGRTGGDLVARRAAGAHRHRPPRRGGRPADHRRGAGRRPVAALRQRADDYAPGDTDLAWTRITPWRTLLAGAFDTAEAPVTAATVIAPAGRPDGGADARLAAQPAWGIDPDAGETGGSRACIRCSWAAPTATS